MSGTSGLSLNKLFATFPATEAPPETRSDVVIGPIARVDSITGSVKREIRKSKTANMRSYVFRQVPG
jgi:hypothetical protein